MEPFKSVAEPPDLTGEVMPLGSNYRRMFAGPYSLVFQGKLGSGEIVAIKVLNSIRGTTLHTMQRVESTRFQSTMTNINT
jgi:hypothetical protein